MPLIAPVGIETASLPVDKEMEDNLDTIIQGKDIHKILQALTGYYCLNMPLPEKAGIAPLFLIKSFREFVGYGGYHKTKQPDIYNIAKKVAEKKGDLSGVLELLKAIEAGKRSELLTETDITDNELKDLHKCHEHLLIHGSVPSLFMKVKTLFNRNFSNSVSAIERTPPKSSRYFNNVIKEIAAVCFAEEHKDNNDGVAYPVVKGCK